MYISESVLLEATNWAPDGQSLLLNGDGLLWRLDLMPTVELKQVIIDGLPPINNDHVLDAPRDLIYLSANDGHIYVFAKVDGVMEEILSLAHRWRTPDEVTGQLQPAAALEDEVQHDS